MKKIVVGGQMEKQRINALICKIAGEQVSVETKSDIEAAMAVKNGSADYYFGACNTGGGGALAMAIAILGMSKCCTVSINNYGSKVYQHPYGSNAVRNKRKGNLNKKIGRR